jgi:hypothetical protein
MIHPFTAVDRVIGPCNCNKYSEALVETGRQLPINTEAYIVIVIQLVLGFLVFLLLYYHLFRDTEFSPFFMDLNYFLFEDEASWRRKRRSIRKEGLDSWSYGQARNTSGSWASPYIELLGNLDQGNPLDQLQYKVLRAILSSKYASSQK